VPNVPTARVTLTRTSGAVSVVRCQEPGELPVWTIHVRGERPIYVALNLRDADRVADHWVSVTR
jgi:hypothetical protein